MIYCDSHNEDKVPFQMDKRDGDFCETGNVKEQVILKIMVSKSYWVKLRAVPVRAALTS